jgi:protoheme IX farnesyltransferase
MLLFAIIFLWTPPHFWALSLYRTDDFVRAKLPMLPVVAGPDATRLQIFLYTIVLIAVAIAPWPLGYFDRAYGIVATVAGGAMLWFAVQVYRQRRGAAAEVAARNLFSFSIVYLFVLFATLLIDALAPLALRILG